MSELTLTEALTNLQKSIDNLNRKMPFDLELWDLKDVAQYLKRGTVAVRAYATTPNFPVPIRLPACSGMGTKGHQLWRAPEIVAWAATYKNGGVQLGRPRKR